MKNKYVVTVFVLMLININHCFCQNKGTAKSNNNTQKTDTTNVNGFYKVVAFFSGNGLKYIKPYNCFGPDLNMLMKHLDSASNGAYVTIESLMFISPGKPAKIIENIPYKFKQNIEPAVAQSTYKNEVEKLRKYNFISGTIYFGGEGFPSVFSVNAKEKITLNNFLNRCKPGTSITLDNCVYRDLNGNLSKPLSINIKLQ